jgi:hypothetical protein
MKYIILQISPEEYVLSSNELSVFWIDFTYTLQVKMFLKFLSMIKIFFSGIKANSLTLSQKVVKNMHFDRKFFAIIVNILHVYIVIFVILIHV